MWNYDLCNIVSQQTNSREADCAAVVRLRRLSTVQTGPTPAAAANYQQLKGQNIPPEAQKSQSDGG